MEPNPTAGLRESAWLHEHEEELADDRHPWVAILGERLVARGSSAEEVFAKLTEDGICDALVAHIRSWEGPRPYLIA